MTCRALESFCSFSCTDQMWHKHRYEAQEASPFLKNSLNMMQGMQAAAQSRQMQLYSYSGNGN